MWILPRSLPIKLVGHKFDVDVGVLSYVRSYTWVCIIGIFEVCAVKYRIIPNILYNTQTTSFIDVILVHHLLGLEDILVMHAVDALGYACHHACRWTPPHPTSLLTVASIVIVHATHCRNHRFVASGIPAVH